jgi:IS30 family transposase
MPTMIYSQVVQDRALHLLSAGRSVVSAAQESGVSQTQLGRWWAQAGGMKLAMGRAGGIPVDAAVPGGAGGRGHRLSLDERIVIHSGVQHGLSYAVIGASIGRDKSVVWREVRRNCNPAGDYHAGIAMVRANRRAHRPKVFKLVVDPGLCRRIESWMDDGWSPKLISRVLSRDFADDRKMQISHETIYQCLYVQTRGELRKDLFKQLSLSRSSRLPHKSSRAVERRGTFTDALKISDRPAEADDRAVAGHWEGDLIVGPYSRSAIGTLVERTTRFTLLLHLPERHTADAVAEAMIAAMKNLPEHLRRTLTWDRGSEMAGYEKIRMELGTPVYFCDPHSPWQRGTNENTNRLLRHWFAKGTDLSQYTAADLKRIQDLLNRRPRPTLDLETPAQRMNKLILQTAG